MAQDMDSRTENQTEEDVTPVNFDEGNPEAYYEDKEDIGHGSFGAVVKAVDRRTGELVAIKKIHRTKKDKDDWQIITNEITAMRRAEHENIVKLVAAYQKIGTIWLVMECCAASASQVLQVLPQALRECEVLAISYHIMQAVAYLHANRIIHRDLKASNILISDNGIAKLADLGSACLSDNANTFVGTPYWMAPEVILAMEEGMYNTAADIWSLGITIIELAEKKPPLLHMHAMSALYQIPHADPPTLETPNNWSLDFNQLIGQCLQKEPASRKTAADLLKDPLFSSFRTGSTVAFSAIHDLITQYQQIMCARSAATTDDSVSDSDRISLKSRNSEGEESGHRPHSFACSREDILEPSHRIGGEFHGHVHSRSVSTRATVKKTVSLSSNTSTLSNIDPGLPLTDKATLRAQHLVNKHLDEMLAQAHCRFQKKEDSMGGDVMNDKNVWQRHQHIIKKTLDSNTKQKKDLQKTQEREMSELQRLHGLHMSRLVNSNKIEADKLAAKRLNEEEQLAKIQAAEKKALYKLIDSETKKAGKNMELKKKNIKNKIKHDELAKEPKNKAEGRRNYKLVWEKQSTMLDLELSKQIAEQRANQEAELNDQLIREKEALMVMLKKESQALHDRSEQLLLELGLSNALEEAELKLKHLRARQELVQQQWAKLRVRDYSWLIEQQTNQKKALLRLEAEEIKMKPKLRKLFKSAFHRQQSTLARAIQGQFKTELQIQLRTPSNMSKTEMERSYREVELSKLTDLAAEFDKALVLTGDIVNSRLESIQAEKRQQLEKQHEEEMGVHQNICSRREEDMARTRQKDLNDLLKETGTHLDELMEKGAFQLVDVISAWEPRLRK
eukprot:Ihof_evm5s153 gene=Ihof_evmTU5s153